MIGVALEADLSIGIRRGVWVMTTDAIFVRWGSARNMLESILVALHAGILVRIRPVNFVALGASLVSFRATREQRLRLGVMTLHAAATLGNPSVRRVTAGAAAMAAPLRADIRVTSALHMAGGAGYTGLLQGSMLLMTLCAANVPEWNLVGVRPHLNFVAAVARLLGDQPSSSSRRDGGLGISGICVHRLGVGRRLNRKAIQSSMRLVAHFAVHAAVEHAGCHAPCAIEFVI